MDFFCGGDEAVDPCGVAGAVMDDDRRCEQEGGDLVVVELLFLQHPQGNQGRGAVNALPAGDVHGGGN